MAWEMRQRLRGCTTRWPDGGSTCRGGPLDWSRGLQSSAADAGLAARALFRGPNTWAKLGIFDAKANGNNVWTTDASQPRWYSGTAAAPPFPGRPGNALTPRR